MSRWLRIDSDLLSDPTVQRLPPDAFKAALYDAVCGQGGAFADFVVPGNGRPSPAEWRELVRAVFARDKYTCVYCGAHGVRLECDHRVALYHGGSNEIDNLSTACRPCNRRKGRKRLEDWQAA